MNSKNKKAKLISISLLALCFSMLAFGVYALKQATLTVGGTIGFKAHDCMVRVLTEIENDGVIVNNNVVTPDADGTPSAKRTFISETTLGTTAQNRTVTKSEANHDIPKIYFTDLTENGNAAVITFTFTVNNDSFYPITANIQTVVDDTYVTSAIETASKQIAANGHDTLSVSYTLKKNANNDYDDLASLNYSIALEFGKVSNGNNQQQEPQQPQVQDLNFNNLPQTHEGLLAALQSAGYTIGDTLADYGESNSYLIEATKNGVVYNFAVCDLDIEYENGAAATAQALYENILADMPEEEGAGCGVNGIVAYMYTPVAQQDPQQSEPEIDLNNLPQNFEEFNALFANSAYNTGTQDMSEMTAEQKAVVGAPANAVGSAQAGNSTHGYQYMFFDTEAHQEAYYTENAAIFAAYYPIVATDRVTIFAGVDATQPYIDLTTMPQTMEAIAALHNTNSGLYTNSIQQAAVKGGDGWNDAYVPEGAEGFLNATKVHQMLNTVTQNYNWMVFDTEAHMLAYKAMAEANMPEGYTLYGESGVVLLAFSYSVSSNNNNNNNNNPEPQEYAGEPVITYYAAPNDDKMHTRQITYYNDSNLTELAYITLETFDTDGETRLTIQTSWPSYDKQTGDLEIDKFEIIDANGVMVEAGQLNYDSNHDITYKYYRYYTNGNLTSSYEYNYQESLNYYDETNQQEVNNYAGYVVMARIADNNNATRVVNYLTQDPTALVTDSAKIDCVRDQYLEYETRTYSDVEVDGKNIPMEASYTILVTDLNDTFRSKQSTSYTYVVVDNSAEVKTETRRTYDSNDDVTEKEVRTWTTYQHDSNNREFTNQGYIGENTLRCTQVFTTDGQADSETWYKNGVVSRTVTRVKNGDQTVSYTERYYQGENLQYRLEVTISNNEEVKTWYNAQDGVIADPELDVENDY